MNEREKVPSMKTGAPSRTAGLAVLVIGLAIGAGLAFTLNYTYVVLNPRTITTTWTATSIVVITLPTIITSTTVYPQVRVTSTQCQHSGSQEYCQVVLKNSGNLGTATTGNCSLFFGAHSYEGYTGPTPASAMSPGAPQQLVPGTPVTTYCQATTDEAASAGAQVTGFVLLADGNDAFFSAIAIS